MFLAAWLFCWAVVEDGGNVQEVCMVFQVALGNWVLAQRQL